MERQGKGMDLFHAGMSIVMTDVEGSTSLWEWNSRIMNSALALHDYTLRSLLPKYFGYEVSWLPNVYVVLRNRPVPGCLLFDKTSVTPAFFRVNRLVQHAARYICCHGI